MLSDVMSTEIFDQKKFQPLAIIIPIMMVLSVNRLVGQDQPQLELVFETLNRPVGIAIQPETGHIFVSESGKNRVIRIAGREFANVITEFESVEAGIEFPFRVNPLSLAFLNRNRLAISFGSGTEGKIKLGIYDIPDVGEPAILASDGKFDNLDLESENPHELGCFGIVTTRSGIYTSCAGDESKGWIARLAVQNGEPKFEEFQRFISTVEAAQTLLPYALAVSPDGFIVVGQAGTLSGQRDSLLTFYDEGSGELKARFDTGLHDICALAYGPAAKRLFALDHSHNQPGEAGLFKLVGRENNTKCVSERIANVERPTAMAFDGSGNLFITGLGPQKDPAGGKLFVVRKLDVVKGSDRN